MQDLKSVSIGGYLAQLPAGVLDRLAQHPAGAFGLFQYVWTGRRARPGWHRRGSSGTLALPALQLTLTYPSWNSA